MDGPRGQGPNCRRRRGRTTIIPSYYTVSRNIHQHQIGPIVEPMPEYGHVSRGRPTNQMRIHVNYLNKIFGNNSHEECQDRGFWSLSMVQKIRTAHFRMWVNKDK